MKVGEEAAKTGESGRERKREPDSDNDRNSDQASQHLCAAAALYRVIEIISANSIF